MGQMTPVGERHGQQSFPRLGERHEGREVGLRAGVGLHIGVLRAEELPGPVDRQPLHLVHHFAAAVIALAGISLGVLVGERGAHRVDHRAGGEILAGDQLEAVPLAGQLQVHQPGDDRIRRAQRGRVVMHSVQSPRSGPPGGHAGHPQRAW
jgi:hypothetical protein